MPLERALKYGVNVALGSDIAAGRSFSMRRIMASAYDNAMCLRKPVTLPDLLTMATLGGARALGCADVIGSLEAGKDADIVAFRSSPSVNGVEHILQELVFDTDEPAVAASYVRGKRLELEAAAFGS
jgi:guanine deaminase